MFFEKFNDPKNDVKTYFSDYVYPSCDTKDGKHTDKPHKKIKDCILYDFTKMCYVEEWSVSQLKEKIDFYKYDIMRSTISINPYGMDEYDKLEEELNGLIKTMKDLEPKLTPSENFIVNYEASKLDHMNWFNLSEMDDIKEMRKKCQYKILENKEKHKKLYDHFQILLRNKHSLDNQKKLGINESVTFVEPYMSWFWKYTKDHNLMGKDEDYEEELKSI